MKLLRNTPLVCAVSVFAVQRLTILVNNLWDDMGHGNVAMYLLLVESKPEDIMSPVY
jgi:hypothetical protein